MVYRSRLKGDCFPITTNGKAGVVKLKNYKQGIWPGWVSKKVTIYNSGTTTVYVGPNGQANFPCAGGGVWWEDNIDPGEVGINDLGTAGTLVVSYGGEPESAD